MDDVHVQHTRVLRSWVLMLNVFGNANKIRNFATKMPDGKPGSRNSAPGGGLACLEGADPNPSLILIIKFKNDFLIYFLAAPRQRRSDYINDEFLWRTIKVMNALLFPRNNNEDRDIFSPKRIIPA